ncbi:MAG TPA: response regulator [bacterium]|nr:response regulator [bacterium]
MKIKVLLIDDELSFCEVMKKGLEAMGDFEVCFCLDSTEGIAEAVAFRPDVILLDVLMPEMSGTLVEAQLRLIESTRLTPVIFLTGLGVDPTRCMSGDDGRFMYVKKPVRIKDLAKHIRRMALAHNGAAE